MFCDIFGYLETRLSELPCIPYQKKSIKLWRVLVCALVLPMICLIILFMSLLFSRVGVVEYFRVATLTVAVNETASSTNDAVFLKLPEVAHVNCARLFQGDKKYIEEIARNKPSISDNSSGVSTCDEIRNKIFPPRNPDTKFPILFARLVYMDYTFIEEQIVANYASENVYCYAIDLKAPKIFHDRIRKLAECLPNVVVTKKELEMDSAGHNHNEAHLQCLSSTIDRKWEYAILMQNHDVIIKTHGEMTEILKIYGGANDVEIGPCPDERCLPSLEKNLGKLQLCPSDFTGTRLNNCKASNLQWGKGWMQAMISRAAAEFTLTKINISALIKEMNDMGYGVDEMLHQTLQINTILGVPGGFHPKCIGNGPQYITRTTDWNPPADKCVSGRMRHSICIYGIEHLPELAASKYILANKMLPDFDYSVVSCMSELMFNRTRIAPEIDRKYYENINLVRYHHERTTPGFNISTFKC